MLPLRQNSTSGTSDVETGSSSSDVDTTGSTDDCEPTYNEARTYKKKGKTASLEFQTKNFLRAHMEKALLDTLEKQPNTKYTETSRWNRSSSKRTAVYKLCKMTRWLLKDEDMIFDPLHRSKMITLDSHAFIDDGFVKAKPNDTAQPSVCQIRILSVNYILSTYLTEKSAENLREIDEALSLLDMSTQDDIPNMRKVSDVCEKMAIFSNDVIDELRTQKSASTTETETAKLAAINWMQNLIYFVVIKLHEKSQVPEESYTIMFQELVALVLQAVKQKKDKYQVTPSTIHHGRRFTMKFKDLIVRSEADLYICHEAFIKKVLRQFPYHPKMLDKGASLIAVVEVKARDAVGNIIQSSGTTPGLTDEKMVNKGKAPDVEKYVKAPSGTTAKTATEGHTEERGGIRKKIKQPAAKRESSSEHTTDNGNDEEDDDNDDAEEADEDGPDFDDLEERKVDSPPNDNLRRMHQDEKLVLRHFLPQLLGELMCTFDLPNHWGDRAEYHGTYRLGIAVTGLLVHFVAFIIHHKDDDFPQRPTSYCIRHPNWLLHENNIRTVVFLTRPLDILKKEDRRIIIKTLASAALLTSTE